MDNYTINGNYDLEFTDDGYLSLSVDTESFKERLKFDLESNSNWAFRDTLGCDWILENNTGMLQQKGINDFIEGYLKVKISSYQEVSSIESFRIEVDPYSREGTITIILKLVTGQITELEVNI